MRRLNVTLKLEIRVIRRNIKQYWINTYMQKIIIENLESHTTKIQHITHKIHLLRGVDVAFTENIFRHKNFQKIQCK